MTVELVWGSAAIAIMGVLILLVYYFATRR